MENKYLIRLDKDNNIISIAYTFDFREGDIEISKEEYEKAKGYKKFNPITRRFTQPISENKAKTQEEVVKDISANVENVQSDTLIAVDLLIEVGLKLDAVIKHLGIDMSTYRQGRE